MPEAQIKRKSDIIDFLFGKQAHFVLKSVKTGKSFAYYARQKTGYMAVYNAAGYLGALAKNPRYPQGLHFKVAEPIMTSQPAAWAMEWFSRHYHEIDKIELWHRGKCSHCGRALTDPKSIERGIGPKCYEVLQTGEEIPF